MNSTLLSPQSCNTLVTFNLLVTFSKLAHAHAFLCALIRIHWRCPTNHQCPKGNTYKHIHIEGNIEKRMRMAHTRLQRRIRHELKTFAVAVKRCHHWRPTAGWLPLHRCLVSKHTLLANCNSILCCFQHAPKHYTLLNCDVMRRYIYLHFNACACETNVQRTNVDKYNTYNVPNKIAPAVTPNRLPTVTATCTHTYIYVHTTLKWHVEPGCGKADRNDLIYTNTIQIADGLPKHALVRMRVYVL